MKRDLFLISLFFLTASTFLAAQQRRSVSPKQANTLHPENSLNASGPMISRTVYSMDFESVPDFSLTFSPWFAIDKDTSATYGIQNVDFPHSGSKMAYIAFNPAHTTPPMTDLGIQPHSGSRFGGCFDAVNPSNNDWFISPRIHLETGGSFSFWVKSYTGMFGLEKYKVAISVTDSNPSSFTLLSGAAPLVADTFWTRKAYELSAYNNQDVYLAIQCVSDTSFLFMIDDIEVQTTVSNPSTLSLDFESFNDFSLTFYPWMTVDVGGGGTYFFQNYAFPNDGAPFAYIVFNPDSVSPPMTDEAIFAHSGKQYGACFSSMPPNNPNNKWLISPMVHLGSNPQIGFWTKTYNKFYGYEKYKVAVSTTSLDPSTFTVVSGPVPLEAPENWGYRQYNLTGFANSDAYVGIQCVTDTGFIFMVDDIRIGDNLAVGDITQPDGVTVYPNPARDRIFINFGNGLIPRSGIKIWNLLGENIGGTSVLSVGSGTYEMDLHGLTKGVYYLSLPFPDKTVIKKIVITGY
jgi:hypothetical protein